MRNRNRNTTDEFEEQEFEMNPPEENDFEEDFDSVSEEELRLKKKAARKRRRKIRKVIDRIFGFFLAAGICAGICGLALEYVIVKGPSEALRDRFLMTMDETRRFGFVSRVFFSEEELNEIYSAKSKTPTESTDVSLITIGGSTELGTGPSSSVASGYELVDEDGDGIILVDIKGKGFSGYMIAVTDPSRVFLGKPDNYEGIGRTIAELCTKYGAIGGINAGGFPDDGGGGLGGLPQGLTIIDGVCYVDGWDTFAGFDENNILHVCETNYAQAKEMGIVNGVSFGPALIVNGVICDGLEASGVNPRTAIAQTANGTVLMLAIDGRQVHSIGATYQDCAELLLSYGAINACNMDGGSSTCMYYQGRVINSCSAANGECRPLPDAWLIR